LVTMTVRLILVISPVIMCNVIFIYHYVVIVIVKVVIVDISKEIEMYLIKRLSLRFRDCCTFSFFNGSDCDRRF